MILFWFLMLFSAARHAFAAYVPALGIQIQIKLTLSDGSTEYLAVNPSTNAIITTNAQASASTFDFDPLTGNLYYPSTNFISGYAVLAFPFSSSNIGTDAAVSLVDESGVQGVLNGVYALSTVLGVAGLVVGQVLGIILENPLTTLTGLALCANTGANLITYDPFTFNPTTGCGPGSLTVTNVQAYIVATTGTSSNTAYSVIPPVSAGVCSVTVVLQLTEITTYVTSGAVLPSTSSPALAPTVPNIYGCSPITSTFLEQVSLYL